MKYMLLIYSSPATWAALSEQERASFAREHSALVDELIASGEWLGGHALTDPTRATAVRVRAGDAMATDGPYIEAKEHLAGYDLVECDSLERAVQIAERIPPARLGGVEIRQLMEPTGTEM